MKAGWDAKKTTTQNYEALGLTGKVNDPDDVRKHAPGLLAGALGIKVEWVDLPEVEEIRSKLQETARNPLRPADFVSEDECGYLQALLARHGEGNFVKMARDIKGNWKQHSAEHLETRIGRMQRLQAAKLVGPGSASSSATMAVDVDETPEAGCGSARSADSRPTKAAGEIKAAKPACAPSSPAAAASTMAAADAPPSTGARTRARSRTNSTGGAACDAADSASAEAPARGRRGAGAGAVASLAPIPEEHAAAAVSSAKPRARSSRRGE